MLAVLGKPVALLGERIDQADHRVTLLVQGVDDPVQAFDDGPDLLLLSAGPRQELLVPLPQLRPHGFRPGVLQAKLLLGRSRTGREFLPPTLLHGLTFGFPLPAGLLERVTKLLIRRRLASHRVAEETLEIIESRNARICTEQTVACSILLGGRIESSVACLHEFRFEDAEPRRELVLHSLQFPTSGLATLATLSKRGFARPGRFQLVAKARDLGPRGLMLIGLVGKHRPRRRQIGPDACGFRLRNRELLPHLG